MGNNWELKDEDYNEGLIGTLPNPVNNEEDIQSNKDKKLLGVWAKEDIEEIKDNLDNLYKDLRGALKLDKYSEIGRELRVTDEKKKKYAVGAVGIVGGGILLGYGVKKVVDGYKLDTDKGLQDAETNKEEE